MRCLPLCLVALLAVPASAQDVASVEPAAPVRGEPVVVTFDAPTDSATVTYRPGAVTARATTVAVGGESFEFTPERAGVVQVKAGDGAAKSLSVRFVSSPLAGVVVMALAGLILFGGAALSLRALLSDGHRIDPELRPDT